jgi:hypothetical protein
LKQIFSKQNNSLANTVDYYLTLIGYRYHLLIVISLSLSQSDHIKRFSLFNDYLLRTLIRGAAATLEGDQGLNCEHHRVPGLTNDVHSLEKYDESC